MQQEVLVIAPDGQSRPGHVEVQHWDQRARLKRSLKTLGMGWGMAVVAVFIPLLHFFLVPALLIGGVAWAMYIYNQEGGIMGGESVCPKCGAKFPIVKGPLKWPLRDVCGACFLNVRIERKAG